MLSDRLTNFSTAAGVYSRYDSVVDIAKLQNEYAEIKGFFRPLVPNFIMENKSFSALNNSAMLAFFPDYRDDSSVDLGFVMYYYVLFESRVSDAFYRCFIVFMCVLSVILKYCLKQSKYKFIDFIMIFSLLYTSSNEMVFARGNIIILFYTYAFIWDS